jgi:LysM repeat protein/predicted nucleic acid-binding Zn ribbon protein
METKPQRHCPNCGMPVAQRAETCLMCGAQLRERKRKSLRLPGGDLWLPVLLVLAIALVWLWKPWQAPEPQAMAAPSGTPSDTPTATAPPTATYEVAPTATPLNSPTPPPTATLLPNQTRHTVKSDEVISTIAKQYGTTTQAILKANGLKSSSLIHPGDELIIPLPIADTPTPTTTPTPSPTPFTYTVKARDTLSEIAKRYGTTVEALMDANGIKDATTLHIGTKLTIVQPPDFTATMAYETYTVQEGDNLYTIAAKYDMTVAQIKEANSLKGDKLNVGQKLHIPVGTATPTPTLTPTETLTPTPGPPYPAPALLSPPDGAAFAGTDTAIVLNWASVGILSEDEWYVLQVEAVGIRMAQPYQVWTKATSGRVPVELHRPGTSAGQELLWQVTIMRQTGMDDDGAWTGDQLSPPGEIRTFVWN